MSRRFTKANVVRNLSNIPGWNTSEKIVVMESDDWGSIRMPSKKVINTLSNAGVEVEIEDGSLYNLNDSLASTEDLSNLFEVLSSIKDGANRSTVITPITIVANPDFEKIKRSGFKKYYYEPFTNTLERYGLSRSYALWMEGIKERLFVPQFHGREHLNVSTWMNLLESGNSRTILAFEHQMWGLSTIGIKGVNIELQAAFDFVDYEELDFLQDSIKEGLDLFEDLFKYRATYFVPPNGPFHRKLENRCFTSGIEYLSTPKIQYEPNGNGQYKSRYNWLGKKSSGLIFLTRNCFFEPCDPKKDWIDSCLNDISIAFKWKKPAVISSHRVNYIGSLNVQNRDNGLKQLSTLLGRIIKKWPEVKFLTSGELGEIIRLSKHEN